jgi:lactoylglutathione lyase
MDVPEKHPGITHVALSCPDVASARNVLEAAGFPIRDGPVRFPTGAQAIFVRDPDGNVLELNQPASA